MKATDLVTGICIGMDERTFSKRLSMLIGTKVFDNIIDADIKAGQLVVLFRNIADTIEANYE